MRAKRIEEIIRNNFSPLQFLEIEDESHKHAGRQGQESHFKVFVVSETFSGQSRVQRQRAVQELLKSEFESGLHALSLRLMTGDEHSRQQAEFLSPNCQGSKQTKSE